jgi:NAD(P)H dehydrogenase (quinone)
MNILIVYAHPNPDSLNGAILSKVKESIHSKHAVQVIDLYKENFNPCLYFDAENTRRDLKNDPEVGDYRAQLVWAEHVIFIFPIWWSGMPAILKGFIDRVFTKGFAYSYKGLKPVGHLRNRTAWVITTDDTPKIYTQLFQHDYGKVLQKQVLQMCGFKKVHRFSLPFVRQTNQTKREAFLNKVMSLSKIL